MTRLLGMIRHNLLQASREHLLSPIDLSYHSKMNDSTKKCLTSVFVGAYMMS